jgi:NitT/TauT family transport system ATP-binding protein
VSVQLSLRIAPDAAQIPCIHLDGAGVTFRTSRGAVEAVSEVSLDIAEREFFALLGPTGCGKSTLLRLIGDLTPPTRGRVEVRGQPAHAARQRNEFGFVFQEPALLPWRTALENVRLPLEVVGFPPERRRMRCEELLHLVGLLGFKDSYPHELSGGMKQRVAIVRALAWEPSILMMDEPFSALDELTRNRLQEDLLALWAVEHKTIVFVTHNISEAVYLADRIVVMSPRPGRITEVLPVDLPRPRLPEMRETMEFIEHVREARKALGV